MRRDFSETKDCWYHTENMITLDEATPRLKPIKLNRFCNKPTMLYLLLSGHPCGYCSMLDFGCIYKYWFLHYDNDPNFEFGRFFADPVRITFTNPQGLGNIVRSHKALCQQASQLLAINDRDEDPKADRYCTTKTHKLLSLWTATVLILDELADYDDIEEDEDGRISLDQYSQVQSVLMVRAGDESHLSAPITFENIKKQEFQLKRDNCDLESVEVIRVSLKVVVKFITTLQKKRRRCNAKWNGQSYHRQISLSSGFPGTLQRSCPQR